MPIPTHMPVSFFLLLCRHQFLLCFEQSIISQYDSAVHQPLFSVLQALRAHAPPDQRGADDWTCPRCKFDNKPNRAMCRECKAKKPDAVRKDQVLSCKLGHACCQHTVCSEQHCSAAVVARYAFSTQLMET